MTQPPRSDPAHPVPQNAEDALAIARTTFQPLCHDGTPAPLHVEEFDIGYLIYATFPPPADPRTPPTFGGANLVISKHDGAHTYVPNYPPESAIELYRERRNR